MINYNRLGYEFKRDLSNFSEKFGKLIKILKRNLYAFEEKTVMNNRKIYIRVI